MAASTIELFAGTAALLLFAVGKHVDVHGPWRKVLEDHLLVGAVVLVCTVDAACVPVRPVDVLAIHGHCKRVDGGAYDDLTVSTGEWAALDLLSAKRE